MFHRARPAIPILGLLAVLAGGAAPAQSQPPKVGANAIAARLVAEGNTVKGGQTVTLALTMHAAPGWHGYWINPGDSGAEDQIKWRLPAGLVAGPVKHPVPRRLLVGGLMNYVHEGDYAQLVEIKTPSGLTIGTRLPIKAKLDLLACTREVCVPQTANLSTEITVGAGTSTENRALFDRFRDAMPKPLGATATFERAGDRIRLAIPVPAGLKLRDPYFFPLTDGAAAYAAPQKFSRAGDMLMVETEAFPNASVSTIDGVLRLSEETGVRLEAKAGVVPAAGSPSADRSAGSGSAASALVALLGAVLGGLLLNVMPCVFPILSLKALSLAKAGGDERGVRTESVAYAAGAVLACIALGGTLLALRASGVAAGWAFQLQDPRAILCLLLLVTAIALNLAGLFELPAITAGGGLAGRGGTAGAFWTGALAAFVATPCTGPFMGAALGAALVLPIAAALAVFAGLGLGLALPFLLLGYIPRLRRSLPRPGPWMDRLRRILSLPMFLTALALAWILGRQAGGDGMALGLSAALALGLSLWWVGERQGRAAPWLPLGIPAVAAVTAAVLMPLSAAPRMDGSGALRSERFSEQRLAQARESGKPVFVYFTADWCVTCKVNEKVALDRPAVANAFATARVTVLVGDWTRGDAAISRFLAAHGRSGVPLYLYYPPGSPPKTLPQVLTPSILVSLVNQRKVT